MVGSSLDAADRPGPDAEKIIYGLDTYVDLIDGPGQYSFEHGTPSGPQMINATHPTAADLETVPYLVRNALVYAQKKEQLLQRGALNFRCDRAQLVPPYAKEEQRCDYEEFKETVQFLGEQAMAELSNLQNQTDTYKEAYYATLFDGPTGVGGMLAEIRAILNETLCRFLWWRWSTIMQFMCADLIPSIIEAAALWLSVAGIGGLNIVIMYKVWRHLGDNKIVAHELAGDQDDTKPDDDEDELALEQGMEGKQTEEAPEKDPAFVPIEDQVQQ
mmetsp:Transcript_17323/g.37410  ORF Transcript_17323/g.37410 Transcript_17323/m.37410 type:complete len:273 (+) Transcript_17323:1-819(+)